jgi:hypothetical protein
MPIDPYTYEAHPCVDCTWYHEYGVLYRRRRCLHPEVNKHNPEYLVSSNVKEAISCSKARSVLGECGPYSKLFTARDGKQPYRRPVPLHEGTEERTDRLSRRVLGGPREP